MLLRYTVALLATLMMLGVATHAWRMRSAALGYLAAWFAAVVIVNATTAFAQQPDMTVPLEARGPHILLNLLAGPLLLNFVHYSLHGRTVGWWIYLPFAAVAALALAFGPTVLWAFGLKRSFVVEAAFLFAAVYVYLRACAATSPRHWLLPAVAGVLLMRILVLMATLTNWALGPQSPPLVYYSVAIIMTIWLSAGLLILVIESPAVRALLPALKLEVSEQEREHFARIETAMRDGQPWRDGDFDLADLAERAGLTSNQVSRALARVGDTNFFDFVNLHRVREAERLLLDPAEARFKVEALGRQAGFRSRSTFFKLFRAHTGLTPAEYRAARSVAGGGESGPSAP